MSAPQGYAGQGGPGLHLRWLRRMRRGNGPLPQVVEAVAQVAEEGVPPAESPGPGERLEPARWAQPPFEVLVVALDALLDRLARLVQDAREDRGQRGRVRGGAISGH